jgi:hypothetical protein
MGVMVVVARSEGNLSQAWCISSCAALIMLDGACGFSRLGSLSVVDIPTRPHACQLNCRVFLSSPCAVLVVSPPV